MAIHKYRLAVVILAVAVLGLGVLLARVPDEKESPQPTERVVEPPKGWEFTGRTQAAAAVEVRARVAGYLTQVPVKEGDSVKKGDVLAKILAQSYQLDLDAARARMKVAEAKLKVEKLKATNTRALAQYKDPSGRTTPVVSLHEVALAEAAEAEMEAGVAVAKVDVERAQMNLAQTQVRAPYDGRVSRIHTTEGNLVTADQTTILTVVLTDPMSISFNVPESIFLQLRRDGLSEPSKLDVAVGFADEKDHPHVAKLELIEPEVDPKTGTARFRATVPNAKGLLVPGMSARVSLKARVPSPEK